MKTNIIHLDLNVDSANTSIILRSLKVIRHFTSVIEGINRAFARTTKRGHCWVDVAWEGMLVTVQQWCDSVIDGGHDNRVRAASVPAVL